MVVFSLAKQGCFCLSLFSGAGNEIAVSWYRVWVSLELAVFYAYVSKFDIFLAFGLLFVIIDSYRVNLCSRIQLKCSPLYHAYYSRCPSSVPVCQANS